MAEKEPARKRTTKRATVTTAKSAGFTVEERAAMRERAHELKRSERGEVQDEVRDARLQRSGEPRRGTHVPYLLRAEGADRRRGGKDRRAGEEGGELSRRLARLSERHCGRSPRARLGE